MTLLVEPASLADAEAMSRLHAEGFASPWAAADFESWLSRPEAFALLAAARKVDDACDRGISSHVLGFGLALVAGDDVELLTIVTALAHRGQMIGQRVFAALDKEASARGLARWLLDVAEDNAPALALYRRLGFEDLARRRGYYTRPNGSVDARVMTRRVGGGGRQ